MTRLFRALRTRLRCWLFGHEFLYYIGPKPDQTGFACWRCDTEKRGRP